MRKDICFVCLGQCAGNIGQLLERKGYGVLFLNTASIDIKLLNKSVHVWKIPGAEGCNQDPEKAQGVFAQEYAAIMQKIISFAQKRIVYFVCSSSGGTGGGMTPLVLEAYLEHLAKQEEADWDTYYGKLDAGESAVAPSKRRAGLITVLPGLDESPIFNANSFNFMRSVWNLYENEVNKEHTNLASYILIDNENNSDLLTLNKQFVDCLDKILKIPEQPANALGNVDNADLENAFTTPGILTMAMLERQSFSPGELIRALKRSNIFTQLEGDSCDYWVSSTTEPLDSAALETELGIPKAYYKTFNDGINLFVVSGAGIPTERIELLADRAEERKRHRRIVNSSVFERKIEMENASTITPANKPVSTSVSVQDKLSKLRRHRF